MRSDLTTTSMTTSGTWQMGLHGESGREQCQYVCSKAGREAGEWESARLTQTL